MQRRSMARRRAVPFCSAAATPFATLYIDAATRRYAMRHATMHMRYAATRGARARLCRLRRTICAPLSVFRREACDAG